LGGIWVLPFVKRALEILTVRGLAAKGEPDQTEGVLVGHLIEVFEAGVHVLIVIIGDG